MEPLARLCLVERHKRMSVMNGAATRSRFQTTINVATAGEQYTSAKATADTPLLAAHHRDRGFHAEKVNGRGGRTAAGLESSL